MILMWILVVDVVCVWVFEVIGCSEFWQEVVCFVNFDGCVLGCYVIIECVLCVNESMGGVWYVIELYIILCDKSIECFVYMFGEVLECGCNDQCYECLVLVVLLCFLGVLYGVMDKQLSYCISGEVQYDFIVLLGEEICSCLLYQLLV